MNLGESISWDFRFAIIVVESEKDSLRKVGIGACHLSREYINYS